MIGPPSFETPLDAFAAVLRYIVPRDQQIDPATPRRMLQALDDLLSGYHDKPTLTTFDAEGADQMIVVRDIPFASLCAHHVLPFTGVASVGYLPAAKIIGLSKVPRIVRMYSRRLQVQEQLTRQIADALASAVEPRGGRRPARSDAHVHDAARGRR